MTRIKNSRGSANKVLSSGLPVAAALIIVGSLGYIGEKQTKIINEHIEREQVIEKLSGMQEGLESTLRQQTENLSVLRGLLTIEPDMSLDRFRSVVDQTITQPHAILGLIAVPSAGAPALATSYIPELTHFAEEIPRAEKEQSGAIYTFGNEQPTITIWEPVGLSDDENQHERWGSIAAVLDSETIFSSAGFRDSPSDIVIALTSSGAGRAVFMGHSSVLSADPVVVPVEIPGGSWALAAVPRTGWQNDTSVIWAIRVLTAVSALFISLLILRSQRLAFEQEQHSSKISRREERMAKINNRLKLAQDATDVGVWEFNAATGELIWDEKMCDLHQLHRPDCSVTTVGWLKIVHPEDRVHFAAQSPIENLSPGHCKFRYRIQAADGTIRHLEMISKGAMEKHGLRLVGICSDVTERTLRNDRLAARQNKMQADIEAKSRFLATVSHEIRTPMNGVLGIIDLMLRGELTREQRERAGVLHDSAQHLLGIVNDLLDMSKLQTDNVILHPEKLNPLLMAHDVVSLMSAINPGGHVQISASSNTCVPENIVTDPLRLRQVMMNLIGNAIKYTDKGTIEIALSYHAEDEGKLIVTVTDTGIGIPEDTISTLFDSYIQVETDNARKRGGTGLGLAISKELVGLMGGRISVSSELGKGSVFSFWIRAPRPESEMTQIRSGKTVPDQPFTGIRILVAASDPVSQRALAGYLDLGGNDATFATDEESLLREARTGAYDIILLDLEMKELDGLATARLLSTHGSKTSDIPVIALVARSGEETSESLADAGLSGWISKPVNVEDLYNIIEANTESPAASDRITAS